MAFTPDDLANRVRQLLITVRTTIRYQPVPVRYISKYNPNSEPPAFLWWREVFVHMRNHCQGA